MITDEQDYDRPITATPIRLSTITTGTVASSGLTARTLTIFTGCTSPGHPLFLRMNVYFSPSSRQTGSWG
jgi:hypothetical protein